MIKILFLIFGILLIPSLVYAQLLPKYPREMNTNYAYTKFSDSFSGTSLDTDKWQVVTNYGRGKCVFVDSVGTTYSVNNGLRLSMIYHPGYCFDDNGIKCPDYISAEIRSKEQFKYGIYEGRMKFATGRGSWPAFWFIGGSGADDPQYNTPGYGSEIDIAEYNWHDNGLPSPLHGYTVHTDHVFHWWWPASLHGGKDQMEIPGGIKNNDLDWNASHTFKLIYTPYDCTFYIDGIFSWRRSRYYTIVSGGPQDIFPENISQSTSYSEWEWFPKHQGSIILSQQVSKNVWNGDISAPQTSLFEWVTYKQFFLAPEITCPSTICSSGTATIDVDPAATNISWSLTPTNLFSGATSGTGKTANLTASSTNYGEAKITYTFNMPSGETFTAEKSLWVGIPPYPVVTSDNTYPYIWTTAYGEPAAKEYTIYTEQDIVFYDENTDTYGGLIDNVDWTWYLDGGGLSYDQYDYGVGGKMYIFHSPGVFRVRASSGNNCGSTGLSAPVFINVIQEEYSMYLSPNPTADETTISITNSSKKADMNATWDLEVYDSGQLLKEKQSGVKGKSTKLNTSNWKDGVYIVRANYNGKMLTNKLVVKH